MTSKSLIKLVASLHQKKFRREHKLFIAEGEKVCRDLLESGWTIRNVFITEKFRKEIFSSWPKKLNAEVISEKELERISALSNPQEIIMVAEIPEWKFNENLLNDDLILMLDNIKDPGNLGTMIRVADWFGIKNIVCAESCADTFNPKTVQASMGSLFHSKIYYQPLEIVLSAAKVRGIQVFGTVLDGENIFKARLATHGIILIGNESNGIDKSLHPFITTKISIPEFSKPGTKKADSLNAAMAAAIVCAEFRRRL